MAEYKGQYLQVFFGGVDISAQGRTVNVSEDAGEPEEIDVTHRGDDERQVLESYPGRQVCNVDATLLDETGGDAEIMGYDVNDIDTLVVYPEGQADGGRMGTLDNARLIQRTTDVPYDGAVEISCTFHAKNTIVWSTYST
jgi:hypothetical protein